MRSKILGVIRGADNSIKPPVVRPGLGANHADLPENIAKTEKYKDAAQGSNITGKTGYYGPKPPPAEKPNAYHFQVFALDTMLNLPTGFNRQALLDAMKDHVIGKGEIIGMYERKSKN